MTPSIDPSSIVSIRKIVKGWRRSKDGKYHSGFILVPKAWVNTLSTKLLSSTAILARSKHHLSYTLLRKTERFLGSIFKSLS
jgi:hypothetical protein